jgi:hypothetical protein
MTRGRMITMSSKRVLRLWRAVFAWRIDVSRQHG